MICIEWIDQFNIGVHEIDEQHKELIGIMNKICTSINEGKASEVIDEALQEMQNYAMTHFALEEKYFNEFHYEKTEAHKAWHRSFSEKVKELLEQMKHDKESVSIDAISFLGGWFIDHTQTFDREYVETFHEHGVY